MPELTAQKSAASTTVAWATAERSFERVLRTYFAAQGASLEGSATLSTLRTNTELVPKRASNVRLLLRELAEVDSLTGLSVLELGCGFGALATYLAIEGAPASLTAVDNRSDYVKLARSAIEPLELSDRLVFTLDDMRTLDAIADMSVDLVIYNNSFIYLAGPGEMNTGLASLNRVLHPGGHVLFYHANRLVWREPFTKAPAVHLLGPRIGPELARRKGWSHNHGRVRLISAAGLRRKVKRLGFQSVRVGGWIEGGFTRGYQSHFASFYGLAARKSS